MSIDKGPEDFSYMSPIPEDQFENAEDAFKHSEEGCVSAKKWLISYYEDHDQPQKAFALRVELARQFLVYQKKLEESKSQPSFYESIYLVPENERGSKKQVFRVAECYEIGHGVQVSIPDAVYWYGECVAFEKKALVRLANIYLTTVEFVHNKKAKLAAFNLLCHAQNAYEDCPHERASIEKIKRMFFDTFGEYTYRSFMFWLAPISVEACYEDI